MTPPGRHFPAPAPHPSLAPGSTLRPRRNCYEDLLFWSGLIRLMLLLAVLSMFLVSSRYILMLASEGTSLTRGFFTVLNSLTMVILEQTMTW